MDIPLEEEGARGNVVEVQPGQEDMASLINSFRREGELIGLTGAKLASYVQDAVVDHRRQQEKKNDFVREKEREEMRLNQEKVLKEKELIQMKELKEAELAKQADLLQLEKDKLEVEKAKIAQTERIAKEKRGDRENEKRQIGKPKLPYFDDKHDEIESYLFRFEKHATMMGWPENDWGSVLSSLLKGKALTYFHELSVEDAGSYSKLSEHLLKRFQCTEEGFRSQFRSAKPDVSENMPTFFARMKRYFTRWTDLAQVSHDHDKLVDLMLREQFLASCSGPLVTFLKENTFKSVEEMVEAAERFREAHPMQSMASSVSEPVVTSFGAAPYNRGQSFGNRGRRPGGQFGFGRGQFHQNQNSSSTDRKQLHETTPSVSNKGWMPHRGRGFCFICGDRSHYQRECPKKMTNAVESISENVKNTNASLSLAGISAAGSLPACFDTCEGSVNGFDALIMLDSGSEIAGVRRSLVQDDQFLKETQTCKQFLGSEMVAPLARVHLDCEYFSGDCVACVIDNPACDFILGKIPGANFKCTKVTSTVQTRAQKAREEKPFRPLLTSKVPQLDITKDKLIELQKADESLKCLFEKVDSEAETDRNGNVVSFVIRDGLLFRRHFSKYSQKLTWQVIVPTTLRESVLCAAHDGLFGGHMASNSTFKRVFPFFFWPGYRRTIADYCRSCVICQKTSQKGRVRPAPLQKVPVIDVPFSRICIDLIGPISPPSSRGHRFVLTAVDVATRFPHAVPMKSVTAEAVAEALISIFAFTGVPDEILCDQGPQFTADLMREVLRLLSVSQLHSAPYHPQTNGVVERFNGTLKTMLSRLMADKPSDWDRYLPGALFAYREIPQSATGFAPFELLFGRVLKGPTQLLFQSWTGSGPDDSQQIASQYVQDLGDSLRDMVKRAQDAVQAESAKSRRLQRKRASVRTFIPGQKVLVLLPVEHSKLLLRWKGPFTVVKKVRQFDYLIEFSGGEQKVYHVNLLKEFVEREVGNSVPMATSAAVLSGDSVVPDEDVNKVVLETVPTVSTETVDQVKIAPDLSRAQRQDVQRIIASHSSMFTDGPGNADLELHTVPMTTERVVNVRQYPLPFESESILREEVEKMLKMGVVEPSKSPYAAPVVMVKKPDGSTRVCLDFRELNKVTTFDAEPIPDPEVLFSSLKGKRYFTKIDLAKGYWQIMMSPEDREKTAFRAPQGLMQFSCMPFGLSTAPSSFARMMRKLHLEEFGAVSFFDDILIASDSWDEHMKAFDGVLERLQSHGLTARPSKVSVGFQRVEFLGHSVGAEGMCPTQSKVSKILKIQVPTTKKQVRSLLGLIGFYRRYIPDYASLIAPLIDLTKKEKPSKVVWSEVCQRAFDKVKEILSSFPVVQLPDFKKSFVVRSDASADGIGAVLLQQGHDGLLHPILYASRKLLDREKRYSTIERECLALVWAVDKFHRYIFGRQFVVETDHRPLTYLTKSKTTNARLQRWALALQEYSFSVLPIAGERNMEADVLSRLC